MKDLLNKPTRISGATLKGELRNIPTIVIIGIINIQTRSRITDFQDGFRSGRDINGFSVQNLTENWNKCIRYNYFSNAQARDLYKELLEPHEMKKCDLCNKHIVNLKLGTPSLLTKLIDKEVRNINSSFSYNYGCLYFQGVRYIRCPKCNNLF